jgi:hypothetical protein
MSDDLDALKAEIDRLTFALSNAKMKIATLVNALNNALAAGLPEIVAASARAALAKAKQP